MKIYVAFILFFLTLNGCVRDENPDPLTDISSDQDVQDTLSDTSLDVEDEQSSEDGWEHIHNCLSGGSCPCNPDKDSVCCYIGRVFYCTTGGTQWGEEFDVDCRSPEYSFVDTDCKEAFLDSN